MIKLLSHYKETVKFIITLKKNSLVELTQPVITCSK